METTGDRAEGEIRTDIVVVPPIRRGRPAKVVRADGHGDLEIRNYTPVSLEVTTVRPAPQTPVATDDGGPGDLFDVPPGGVGPQGGGGYKVRNGTDETVRVSVRPLSVSPRVGRALAAASTVNTELADLSVETSQAFAAAVSDQLAEPGVGEADAVAQAACLVPEVERLSAEALRDLRLALVLAKPAQDRDAWIGALNWQSAEDVGRRLTTATWGLVAATLALVAVTIVLVVITAVH